MPSEPGCGTLEPVGGLRNRVEAREQRDDEDQGGGQTPPTGSKVPHPGSDGTHRILFSEDSAEGGLPHRG